MSSRRALVLTKETHAEIVFRYVKARPRTCTEVEALSGIKHQSCSARFHELVKAGCIRRTSETRNGAEVHEVVPGATMELFRQWQTEHKTHKPKRLDADAAVLAACRRAAHILRSPASSEERGEALACIEQAILTNFN